MSPPKAAKWTFERKANGSLHQYRVYEGDPTNNWGSNLSSSGEATIQRRLRAAARRTGRPIAEIRDAVEGLRPGDTLDVSRSSGRRK